MVVTAVYSTVVTAIRSTVGTIIMAAMAIVRQRRFQREVAHFQLHCDGTACCKGLVLLRCYDSKSRLESSDLTSIVPCLDPEQNEHFIVAGNPRRYRAGIAESVICSRGAIATCVVLRAIAASTNIAFCAGSWATETTAGLDA